MPTPRPCRPEHHAAASRPGRPTDEHHRRWRTDGRRGPPLSARASCDELVDAAASTPSSSPSPTCRAGCRASGCTRSYFLDEVLGHGTEGCNYLLAVDVDMNTVDGLRDVVVGDAATATSCCDPTSPRCGSRRGCRRPSMVQCDVLWLDGAAGACSRRGRSCRARSSGPAELGFAAFAGTELEFIVFEDTYEQAWDRRLPRPDPVQPVQRRLLDPRHRRGSSRCCATSATPCTRAGLGRRVGQGRVQLRPARDRLQVRRGASTTADQHASTRRPPRRSPPAHGKSLTFMAKFNEREGNSCHIHMSLRGHGRLDRVRPRRPPATRRAQRGLHAASSPGVLATLREFTLLYAPNINSYKRFQPRHLRADGGRLGRGQPHLRGARRRARARRCGWRTGCPAATSTPTSRSPAMLGRRAARHRAGLELRARARAATPTTPTAAGCRPRCARRATSFAASASGGAATAFGDEVVDHYVERGRRRAGAPSTPPVTDWERVRGFERL